MSEINELFFGECREGLDAMEAGLLELGRGKGDSQTINRIFRAAHSIKGGGATFGFPELSSFAHTLETLLSEIREGARPILPDDIQLLLDATDCLRGMVNRIEAGTPIDTSSCAALSSQLARAIASGAASGDAGSTPAAVAPMIQAESAAFATVPFAPPLPPATVHETTTPRAITADGENLGTSGNGAQSIRVDIDKIDRLINLVGELLITQSTLSRFERAFQGAGSDEFNAGLSQLQRNTQELQESVLAVRMLPISVLFSRIPRLVRDLSRRLGKPVELHTEGTYTEVDKTILERLSDPLAHLVRNAIDHGIETPEVRARAGKPATARIDLRATQAGGRVVIEIADDGAGIDAAKVRSRAIRAGLIAPQDQLSEHELHDLIFRPGFSTAEMVDDVSGRGVGLDVVKQSLFALSGSIELQSVTGRGARFTISLPLTLAIIDSQLIRCGEGIYAIPLSVIVELIDSPADEIRALAGGGETYLLRNQFIPVLRLRDAFGLSPDHNAPTMLAIVEMNGQLCAITIDSVLEQQQIVVKSLDANYRPVPGLSGATILGDGTLALIIDVGGLIQSLTSAAPRTLADDIAA